MPVSDHQKVEIDRIAKDYGLKLVLLFGSEVSGKLHQGSDLDVAVLFQNQETANDRVFELIAEMQVVFPEREVDIGLINSADPLFLKKILEDCELLSGEPRSLSELKMYAFRRYIDHKRFLKMEEQYIKQLLERLEKGAA